MTADEPHLHARCPEPRSPLAPLNLPLIVLIRAYQVTLSPFLGRHCRFHPTCSTYGLDACRLHNPARACWLIARRLLSCRPGGRHGFDPAPPYLPRSGQRKP